MGTDAKEQQLLQILWQRNSWVTCQELADRLDISPRSVRYLISKINGSMPEAAVISSRNGYQLRSQNTDLMRRFASYTAPDSPDSAAERKRYIFKHMVIQGQIAEIDTLCDRFCISPLTFRNELAVWRNDLSKYGLYVKAEEQNIVTDRNLYAPGSGLHKLPVSNFKRSNRVHMRNKILFRVTRLYQ